MNIRLRSSGKVISDAEFRLMHANTSFPEALTEAVLHGHDADPVLEAAAPIPSATQVLQDGGVAKNAHGKWVRTYVLTDKPAGQVAAELTAKRAGAWEKIKAERERRKNGGVLVDGKWFHSDADSRIQFIAMVLMGANAPADPWKTMDGTFVTMTKELSSKVFLAVVELDRNAFARAELHLTGMTAAADPASYDITTGWPAVFQG